MKVLMNLRVARLTAHNEKSILGKKITWLE